MGAIDSFLYGDGELTHTAEVRLDIRRDELGERRVIRASLLTGSDAGSANYCPVVPLPG